MINFVALLSGIVFGLGIILSGMVNPAIVLAFLDIAGSWDAALLWVMGGAVTVGMIAFALARKRTHSYLGTPIHIPAITKIDRNLLAGSFIFGIGWGIAGMCPGPAVVLVGAGSAEASIFLIAMLLGMGIYETLQARR
ncbi:hypothetical protein C8R34_10959 [Nitrosomonas sp. Nm84]|uniref:DUF6691 family protein n=1 Tax=Nitrosomonas sp. Nm84 TaxID=200124 RepID=UPI000D756671|nr:DUF6691 family protein [Nitrosomonas sp. Nm84]PXW87811.1 hypothetical protein C8R34_10959 [Nitrosomonas sp. Nm84]